MSPEIFNYLVLPLLIFIARIFDVTIGTLRIILVARGKKSIAPILGFFEVLIWVIAIGQIMSNLDNWVCFLAYAAGFATGNYVGMRIEEKLAMGIVGIRIITTQSGEVLIDALRVKGYGLTTMDAKGREGDVHVVFITLKRSNLKEIIPVINEYNPKAFYTIEDIRYVNAGFIGSSKKMPFRLRKGK